MKSYFKFLSRNKLYTAIEAFGLSIALAFVMILVSYAFMEYRVGTHQPDAKNLYVPGSGDYLGMTLGTAKEFFPSIPEIKEWTRFSDYYTDKGAVVNDQYYHVQARAIDPNFLDMMGMKCRGCSAHRVLTDKHQALISESFAKRAFCNANPIGQVVTCDTLQFKVVGIVDDFGREDLLEPTDIFVSMKFKDADLYPMDQFSEVVTIVRLADGADPEKVNATLLNKYMGYWKKWWSREKTTGSFLWGSSLVRWDKLYFSDITCSCPYHAKMKKIMKRIGILIGWLVWTAGVSAQSWSLDDCMKYAVEHATEVKREVVNARQRKQDYQHAVAGFLPTVTGGVQGQYAWGRNIDPETNTYNNVTTFNNYYQLYAELMFTPFRAMVSISSVRNILVKFSVRIILMYCLMCSV
jgi:hypothetical protein